MLAAQAADIPKPPRDDREGASSVKDARHPLRGAARGDRVDRRLRDRPRHGRLNGELTRTAYQLRFFGEVLREGSYLEAVIDHAGDTPMGPRPDLRRMLVPIGPVAVYAASNFPLASSVPGGDTAAALAAGCGVVVKAHPAHPATSALVDSIIAAATEPVVGRAVSVVYGYEAGIGLVQAPAIRAASFTGSPGGGRALAALAEARPEPIPFYGELGSINPVLVSPAAAAARAASIAEGLAGSIVLGGGQFCTKPGIALVPAGADGDALVSALATCIAATTAAPALTPAMATAYAAGLTALEATPGARPLVPSTVASGTPAATAGGTTKPALIEFAGEELPADSVHTSVGATSIRRYLRPVAWQNAPRSELPPELRDASAPFPRRIDGTLTLPTP